MQKPGQTQQKTLLAGIFVLLLLIAGVSIFLAGRGTNTLNTSPAVTNADEGAGDTAITDTTLTTSLTAADSYNGCKIILFTAAWDSFSVRAKEMLDEQLVNSNECYTELDINVNRVEASEFDITMPPGLVIFPSDGDDTVKTYSNLSIDKLAKIVSTL